MSALGDIVHALPVLAAIRSASPDTAVDWLADRKYAGVLDLVDGLDRRLIGRPGLLRAIGEMRAKRYDAAIDLQGLLKSAAMARFSGAARVIGFARHALREPGAAWFYNETATPAPGQHIIAKNLSLLPLLGIPAEQAVRFPFSAARLSESDVAIEVMRAAERRGADGFALLNPGAAWPNKRWPPERFGAVARHLRERHGLPAFVLWGAGEAELADAVVSASSGAAVRAPSTSLADLLALSRRARLMLSGDTGPLHLAAAMGTPIVGLYGPTWPERNGPWAPDDVVVSRAGQCECHHKRHCQRAATKVDGKNRMCINDISVDEVERAVDARLARTRSAVI